MTKTYLSENDTIHYVSIIDTALMIYYNNKLKEVEDLSVYKAHDIYEEFKKLQDLVFEKFHGRKRFESKDKVDEE